MVIGALKYSTYLPMNLYMHYKITACSYFVAVLKPRKK